MAAGATGPLDAGTIAFVSSYRVDAWERTVLEAPPRGAPKRLVGRNVVTSPDGALRATVDRRGTRTVLTISDRSRRAKKVVRWRSRAGNAGIEWAPDGSALVATVADEITDLGNARLAEPAPAYLVATSAPLVRLGRAWSAAWSPDSTRFAVLRAGAVEIRRADGHVLRRLPGASELAWSADGERTAYVLAKPTRVVVGDRGGKPRMTMKARLARMDARVSWSEIGRRLVVEFYGDGPLERWIVEGGRKRLARTITQLGWKGRELLLAPPWLERRIYDSNGWLYELSPDERTVYLPDGFYELETGRRLERSPQVPRTRVYGWSPDSRWFLVTDRRRLVALAVPGFTQRVVTEIPTDANLEWARWGADGNIRFKLTTATFPRLHLLDAATGEPRAITEIDAATEPFFDYPAWSPDGRLLAAVRYDDRGDGPGWLVVLEPGRSKERRLGKPGAGRPSWTPEGSRLVIVEGDEILLRRLSDGVDELAAKVPKATGASIAPDGRRLAVTTVNSLIIVPLDRPQDQTNVVSFAPYTSRFPPREPAWSPDGSLVAYTGPTGLHVVAADGSSPPRLLVRPAAQPSGATWTARGDAIVFAAVDPACEGRLRLMQIPAAGGLATHLFRMPGCSGSKAPSLRP